MPKARSTNNLTLHGCSVKLHEVRKRKIKLWRYMETLEEGSPEHSKFDAIYKEEEETEGAISRRAEILLDAQKRAGEAAIARNDTEAIRRYRATALAAPSTNPTSAVLLIELSYPIMHIPPSSRPAMIALLHPDSVRDYAVAIMNLADPWPHVDFEAEEHRIGTWKPRIDYCCDEASNDNLIKFLEAFQKAYDKYTHPLAKDLACALARAIILLHEENRETQDEPGVYEAEGEGTDET